MARDEWSRPRYEHRDVRAEYSSRGFRGRSRGWRKRGRWRPRFERRRWDDERPQRDYDHYDDPMNEEDDHLSSKYSSERDFEPKREPLKPSLSPKGMSPKQPETAQDLPLERSVQPHQVPEPSQQAPKEESQHMSSDRLMESEIDGTFDSDATDDDLTAQTAETLRIQLPPTQLESYLMDLYSQLPKQTFKYLSSEPFEFPQVPSPSDAVIASIKRRQQIVTAEIDSAREAYKQSRKKWLVFCGEVDSEVGEVIEAAPAPELPESPRQKGGRRNRSHGDAVRSEAEFMRILANLEMATARDPLIRARLTSVAAPAQIFDPEVRKAVFVDTNNAVIDKSTLKTRLLTDNLDNFTEEEHQQFCDAYVQSPKQFGKISAAMGGFRSFHECVMHYYRTKKSVDYKLLLQKRKPKGRRGRKPKKSRMEENGVKLDEETEVTTTVTTSMDGDSSTTIEVQLSQDGPLSKPEPPLLPEPLPLSSEPEPLKVTIAVDGPVLVNPPAAPESPGGSSSAVATSNDVKSIALSEPQAELMLPNKGEESETETMPNDQEKKILDDIPQAQPQAQSQPSAGESTMEEEVVEKPVENDLSEIKPTAGPAKEVNSGMDSASEAISDPGMSSTIVKETPHLPVKPASSTSTSWLLPIPVRAPQTCSKPGAIPPPVQPLDGNQKADPVPSNGIDALATLALESERKQEEEEKKGRRTRKRKDSSKPTSYWNAGETKKFETLLGLFGTKWDEIAKHIPSKTIIMLKNYYTKYKATKDYEAIARAADTRNSQTGVMPVYVSAEVDEDVTSSHPPQQSDQALPSGSAIHQEIAPAIESSAHTISAPAVSSPSPTPETSSTTPGSQEMALSQRSVNGPPTGFFKPRQRQLPVQSYHPDEVFPTDTKKNQHQQPQPQPAAQMQRVPQPSSEEAHSIFQVNEQPPRPFVRPRTSMLASILRDGAELPRPKSSFMEADNYKLSSVLPFMGGGTYRESNERGHN